MFSVCQTCYDVLLLNLRGFCTVFGFSLFGRVGVYSGISQWYRVGDAGALRAKPLATLCLARSKQKHAQDAQAQTVEKGVDSNDSQKSALGPRANAMTASSVSSS